VRHRVPSRSNWTLSLLGGFPTSYFLGKFKSRNIFSLGPEQLLDKANAKRSAPLHHPYLLTVPFVAFMPWRWLPLIGLVLCKRQGQPIVCTNDIWIERAFRQTDTDTMAQISTFLAGEMIRPGSNLWNALCSPGNTRNLFATGSSHRYYPSYWKDISIDHKHDVTWHLQMAAPYRRNGKFVFFYTRGKGKSKAIPLQAWTDPEGSRRLRFPDFKTIGTWRW